MQAHIDIAAAQEYHGRALAGDLAGKDRSNAHSSTALDYLPLLDIGMADGVCDLGLANEDRVVEQVLAHRKRPAIVQSDAAAEGIGEARLLDHFHRMAGPQALIHRGTAFHGDADDPGVRLHALDGKRDAGDEPAAGERHDNSAHIGDLLDDLEPCCTLAGDDLLVVEGREHDHALFLNQPVGRGLGLVLGSANDADPGTQGLDRLDLVLRHETRHDHEAVCAGGLGGMGEAATVIAGGNADNAPGALLLAQREHGIGGTAELERAGDLMVLLLEQDGCSGPLGKGRRGIERGSPDMRSDALAGGVNVRQGQLVFHLSPCSRRFFCCLILRAGAGQGTCLVSIPYEVIEQAALEIMKKAAIDIPGDYLSGIRGMIDLEKGELSAFVLESMVANWEAASEDRRPMCADTGLPRYYVKMGNEAAVEGGMIALEKALRTATARATKEVPLRPNRVHPLWRTDHDNNVGINAPEIDWSFEPHAGWIDITSVHKGGLFGTDYRMLFPGDGIDGVKRFFLDTLIAFGKRGLACQPAIIGIGLGGSKDTAMVLGKQAACLRIVGDRNPDPKIAALEEELRELGNSIGMGAMGLVGTSMCVDVHIEAGYTHTGGMPMSVHTFCLSSRRATVRIHADGEVEYRTDPAWFTPYLRRETIDWSAACGDGAATG